MKTIRKRIAAGMSVYAYAQLVTIITQLIGMPLFLNVWNTEQYGVWLLLTTVPVYLAMFDIGVFGVAGNRMTMLMAAEKFNDAVQVFHAALLFLMAILLLITLIAVGLLWSINLESSSLGFTKATLAILIATSGLCLFNGLFDALFKANEKYALGMFLFATVRLFEWLCSIVALYIFNDLLYVALGYFFGSLMMTGFIFFYVRKEFKLFSWKLSSSAKTELKNLLTPAISFMAYPLSNLFNIQGLVLLVGWALGPTAVVVFSAYRTITRFLLQGVLMISKPIWPEISKLFGRDEIHQVKKLYVLGMAFTFAFLSFGWLVFYFFGEFILAKWVGDSISYQHLPFLLLLSAVSITGLVQLPVTLLGATNQHSKLYTMYFGLTLAFTLPLVVLAKSGGLITICSMVLALEFVFLLVSFYMVRRFFSRYSPQKLDMVTQC